MRTCWGPAARDACHTVRGWCLMFLLGVGVEKAHHERVSCGLGMS